MGARRQTEYVRDFSPNYNLTSEVRENLLGGSSLCDPPYIKLCVFMVVARVS